MYCAIVVSRTFAVYHAVSCDQCLKKVKSYRLDFFGYPLALEVLLANGEPIKR